MSTVDKAEVLLEAIELSGPPRLFVLSLPTDSWQEDAYRVSKIASNLGVREFGHRILVMPRNYELREMSDYALRQLGLMRILAAAPAQTFS